MKTETKMKMWGNSLGVRIPKIFSEKLKLREGSEVIVSIKENSISIYPSKKKKINLKNLVSLISEENRHSIAFDNNSKGSEIW